MTRKRTKTAIHQLDEGGFVVRGTTDPTEALRILVDQLPNTDYWWADEIVDGIARDTDDDTLTDDDKAANAVDAAHWFARRLDPTNHRAGWFRINPCACGEHSWDLGWVDGPGRGNFQGVSFE